jgi:hypothetical protein
MTLPIMTGKKTPELTAALNILREQPARQKDNTEQDVDPVVNSAKHQRTQIPGPVRADKNQPEYAQCQIDYAEHQAEAFGARE